MCALAIRNPTIRNPHNDYLLVCNCPGVHVCRSQRVDIVGQTLHVEQRLLRRHPFVRASICQCPNVCQRLVPLVHPAPPRRPSSGSWSRCPGQFHIRPASITIRNPTIRNPHNDYLLVCNCPGVHMFVRDWTYKACSDIRKRTVSWSKDMRMLASANGRTAFPKLHIAKSHKGKCKSHKL